MRVITAVLLPLVLLVLIGCPAEDESVSRGGEAERGLGAQQEGQAISGRRVALVVGNNNYPTMRLRNAVNDARSMRGVLRQLGFSVQVAENTGRADLQRAVRGFIGSINPGDVAMFYYSGHGIQVDGENFLVPTDFDAVDEIEAESQSYSAELVRERMEQSGSRLNIIVLDACRDNPFTASRSGSRGLAAMNVTRGTFIAFATGPGQTASDNPRGNNGLFTSYLIEALRIPGLRLEDVFRRVGGEVSRETGGRQAPWIASSVYGDFYFIQHERVADVEQPAEPERPTETVTAEPQRPSAQPPAHERPTETATAEPSRPTAEGVGSIWRDRAGLEYVYIHPGSFQMGAVPGDSEAQGDESPRHRVTISRGFRMSRTEVTVRAYKRFCDATGRSMPPAPDFNLGWRNLDHPIVRVTWNDAVAYCRWAGVRLPTEAEWEYACRAGTSTKYYWGNNMDGRYAWYSVNCDLRTHEVRGRQPNEWGLYDMLGNVWEWCSDWYDDDYYGRSPSRDPQGPSSGEYRVLRGGSWGNYPRLLRVSNRNGLTPGSGNYNDFGFRCIRDLDSLNP